MSREISHYENVSIREVKHSSPELKMGLRKLLET